MGIRAEIKDAIVNGHLYDFVSNNSYRMDKDDFIDLVKTWTLPYIKMVKKNMNHFVKR